MNHKAIFTTVLEVIALALIVIGIYLAVGLALALISAGALILGASFLITTRGGRS